MTEKINLTPLDNIPSSPAPNSFSKPNFPLVTIIPVILILFVVTFSFAYNLGKDSSRPDNSLVPTPSRVIPSTAIITAPPYLSPTPINVNLGTINPGAITWLAFPKPTTLNAYQSPDSSGYIGQNIISKDIKFMEVATFADGSKLINSVVPSEGMGIWYKIEHFIKTPANQIYFIIPGSSLPDNSVVGYLRPEVKFSNFFIEGIEAPDSITSDKGTFYPTGYSFDNTISFTELKNPQLITTTPYGRIYSVYTSVSKELGLADDTNFFDRKTWLRLKDDTVEAYELKQQFISDDKVPQITWNDGTKNTLNYEPGFSGKCGSNYGTIFKDNSSLAGLLVPSGTNSQNQTIYTISDTSHPIFQKMYDKLDPSARPNMSTFLKRKTHFVWQDTFGDWWLFLSTENQVQAECAKPVIYLYPQKDTQVSVKVGANITLSEPLYPTSGWTVFAHSNGQLDYQGQTYPNLFWEGTGHGIYNSHQGEGFVVPQQKLVSTIFDHLKLLGLNSQESADFMDFWVNKLPSTPYVRLTWLNTDDMNRLAPLQVVPAPKTLIRIFLDFEGLSEPVKLIPQKLSAPIRQGFTLVEWGGLLIK